MSVGRAQMNRGRAITTRGRGLTPLNHEALIALVAPSGARWVRVQRTPHPVSTGGWLNPSTSPRRLLLVHHRKDRGERSGVPLSSRIRCAPLLADQVRPSPRGSSAPLSSLIRCAPLLADQVRPSPRGSGAPLSSRIRCAPLLADQGRPSPRGSRAPLSSRIRCAPLLADQVRPLVDYRPLL